jgi:hypothetical protein
MNKIMTSMSVVAFSMAASLADAAVYDVYGLWNSTSIISATSGGPSNSLIGANLTISGQVTTDTNTAGYNITGGTLSITGTLEIPYNPGTGVVSLYQTYNGTGTATNAGVVFNSGTLCLGYAPGDCSAAFTDLSVNPALFDGTGTFQNGAFGSTGLRLTGGAGGASFTVAQPGVLTNVMDLINNKATGTIYVAGNYGALFLGSSLTFTEVTTAPEVPLPAAAWLFGSALLGLTGVARNRRNRA